MHYISLTTRRSIVGIGVILILAGAVLSSMFITRDVSHEQSADNPPTPPTTVVPAPNVPDSVPQRDEVVHTPPSEELQDDFVWPMDRADARITKKPFGIAIDPRTSPVQPERFSGYHTGTDFEVFPEEAGHPVAVHAVCDGVVRSVQRVRGYGSVVVQACHHDGAPITVLYGHVTLRETTVAVGDTLTAGEAFTVLGAAGSTDTDGERQHLHLGIHKTDTLVFAGYVPRAEQLVLWVDFEEIMAQQ